VRSVIRQAAKSNLGVLIEGETGTGKELAARMVHDMSLRAKGPFVAINCAAIPKDLLESELFGYEKGAFTGATAQRSGLLEAADGGTFFMDEVGDLSPEGQARLLRVLESNTFRRVGGRDEIRVNIRIIAATNKITLDEVSAGRFREDLYYRLKGYALRMPALRDRPSDIPLLAEYFFEQARLRASRPVKGLSETAVEALRARRWPGNVRELKATIERALEMARGEFVETGDLGEAYDPDSAPVTLEEIEKQHILQVVERCEGRMTEAAKILGIGRTTLYEKMARYNKEE
jgi:DNA-binding NtrC family response regulator